MGIEDSILLNQLAQGVKRAWYGERWFMSKSSDERVKVFLELNAMIH